MLLKNKIAMVTGSTSGIGLGIAHSLAKQGVSLMINGLVDQNTGESLAKVLAEQYGIKTAFNGADLSKTSDIEYLFAHCQEALGPVDVLVNNAGIQYVSEVESFPLEKWNAVLAINLTSAFVAIQKALPNMKKNNWGRIVNIASVHGLVASANKSAYVSAKHGLIGLTKTVALETARTGVTCNAVCPGWVLTPLVQKQIDDQAARLGINNADSQTKLLQEKQPSLQFATPEQIGETVNFLCSPAAEQIRGVALNMDGGWLAQ